MQLIGEGTERVEEDAKRLFPHAAVVRLDGDTMRRPAQAEALWRRVEQGEWDIIVGTQLLLRRGPLPTMGLVGIVQADAGLSVPDFRSAERTYHTLLDAVSLADPAGAGGQVIVQTYLSSHHAIQAVAQNDESVFLSEELSHRTALGYPPMVHLIALLVSGTNEKMVHDAATAWVDRLTACTSPAVAGQTAAAKAPSTTQSIGRLRPSHCSGAGPLSGAETPGTVSVANSREIVRTGSGARSGADHSQGDGTDLSAPSHQVRCRRRSDRDVVDATCSCGTSGRSDCGAGGWLSIASVDAAAMGWPARLKSP